jgi:hypothetical protein
MSSSGQCPRTPVVGARWRAQTTGSFCGCPSEDTLTGLPHEISREISRRGAAVPSGELRECVRLRRRARVTNGFALTSRARELFVAHDQQLLRSFTGSRSGSSGGRSAAQAPSEAGCRTRRSRVGERARKRAPAGRRRIRSDGPAHRTQTAIKECREESGARRRSRSTTL